ncbi:hypothetical protein DICA1_E05380 [Diutina catenulata]
MIKRWASSFRRLSTLRVSPEVSDAVAAGKPVVSLESTIITHGLPFPQNLEMAHKVEQIVRDGGAVPATCAFIGGVPHVGLSETNLQLLADEAQKNRVTKVSRRDIGAVMATRRFGGTTIASTMILSHLAGIQVFATGGLGGVHRGAPQTFDVSADLTELGRTPVSVVCSGPKSILDIPLTMEYLETQGVLVATYNDDGQRTEVPGFYCRESGVKSPYIIDSFGGFADIIRAQKQMGLQGGNVFCIPPPTESALESSFISSIIDRANRLAEEQGVVGKETTPFLLAEIAKQTQGKSVDCNVKFVYNNARAATQIALALAEPEALQFQPTFNKTSTHYSGESPKTQATSSIAEESNSGASKLREDSTQLLQHDMSDVSVMVVGSIAIDTIARLDTQHMHDSNPGQISSSIGGVGHNIAMNAHNSLKSPFVDSKNTSALISIVGDDLNGHQVMRELGTTEIANAILVSRNVTTSQYVSCHRPDGELVIACADMRAIETDFSQHVIDEIDRVRPSVVVVDCNLSGDCIDRVLRHCQETPTIVDPTSVVKEQRLANTQLGVFPNHNVSLITPTTAELDSIYSSFAAVDKFDDLDAWFPVLDQLGANQQFRDRLFRTTPFSTLLENGTLQQSFKLLPYFPHQLIKLGAEGVVSVSISTQCSDYKSLPTTSPYRPACIMTSKPSGLGIVVKYWSIPHENSNLDVKNVTGAGDAFVGFLSATLAKDSSWLEPSISSVEQEWFQWECIYKAQVASGLTLQADTATTARLQTIA